MIGVRFLIKRTLPKMHNWKSYQCLISSITVVTDTIISLCINKFKKKNSTLSNWMKAFSQASALLVSLLSLSIALFTGQVMINAEACTKNNVVPLIYNQWFMQNSKREMNYLRVIFTREATKRSAWIKGSFKGTHTMFR